MHTTDELLDAVKARHGLPSDYKLGLALNLAGQSTLTNYRKGRSRPDDEVATRIADLLELEPAYVIACIHAERATTDVLRKVWEGIAERARDSAHGALGLALGTAVMVSALFAASPDASAVTVLTYPALDAGVVCILCQLALSAMRRARRAAPGPPPANLTPTFGNLRLAAA